MGMFGRQWSLINRFAPRLHATTMSKQFTFLTGYRFSIPPEVLLPVYTVLTNDGILYRKSFVQLFLVAIFSRWFFTLQPIKFYHACDQTSQFKFCILPYSVLQFGDFYSSLTSVWLTALVVADPLLTESIRFFIGLTGTVIIAVCVHYDATSLATFLIPTVSGLLLISASWVNNFIKF